MRGTFMRDKTAARRKAKRREETRRAANAELNAITEDFYAKIPNGRRRWNREKIRWAHREVMLELERETNIVCVVAVSYCMRRLYGFGPLRLFRLGCGMMQYITAAYTNDRSAEQFAEEMEYDADFRISDFWERKIPEFKGRADCVEKNRAIWHNVPSVLNIAMYAVYTQLGFRKKRMRRLCGYVCPLIALMLRENKLKEYMDELAEHGFTINMRGQFKAKLTDEQYERCVKGKLTA